MDSLRKEYISYVTSATWPTNSYRVNVVYNTMSRAVRDADEHSKRRLLDLLCAIGDDFHDDTTALTSGQSVFDAWHEKKRAALMQIPFTWTDGSHGKHTYLTLGLAQKFLNLMLKDWWGTGSCKEMDYSVLHAPFDNQVWKVLWELHPRFDCPSLKKGNIYKGISHWDRADEYRSYQSHLLSPALSQAVYRQMQGRMRQLGLSQPPCTRIEMEQLLWSK